MSRVHARLLVVSCTQSTTRLQAVVDMLLLTDTSWPVIKHQPYSSSFQLCKDQLFLKIADVVRIIQEVKSMFSVRTHAQSWPEMSSIFQALQEAVIDLTQLCAHNSYLLVEMYPNCKHSSPGITDQFKVRKAFLDIKMCGNLIKISSHEQLIPPVLVEIAQCLSDNLTRITKYCTTAADNVATALDQEQLRSCVKCLATAGSSVMTSLRLFKAIPNEKHLKRCVSFYDALIVTIDATVALLTEDFFIGKPAELCKEAINCRKRILGACLNIVSSCIQLYNIIKEYAYDTRNPFIRDRLIKCTDAILQATVPLREALHVVKAPATDTNLQATPTLGHNRKITTPLAPGSEFSFDQRSQGDESTTDDVSCNTRKITKTFASDSYRSNQQRHGNASATTDDVSCVVSAQSSPAASVIVEKL